MRNFLTSASVSLATLLTLSLPARSQTDSSPPPSATPTAKLSAQDIEWMKSAAQGDMFDIAAGTLAKQRARTTIVQQFGQRMVIDHTRSLNDLKDLAAEFGVELPNRLDPDKEVVLRYFTNSISRDWDLDYITYEIEDHNSEISEANAEIKTGTNEDVKAEATSQLRVLRQHLALAQAASRALAPRRVPTATPVRSPTPTPRPTATPTPTPRPPTPTPTPTPTPASSPTPGLTPAR